MPKRKGQEFPTPEENPRFHDTYQFLRRYRDATYSLKVVVHQMENHFKVQYGSSIDEFLDSTQPERIWPEAILRSVPKALSGATGC